MATHSPLSTAELSELKVNVLNSVLNDLVFPGSNFTLRFADLPFVLTQPDIYLVDKKLKSSIQIERLNRPVQIVSKNFIKEKSGKTIYLEFQSEEQDRNILLLTLNANIFSSPENRTINLSSLKIKFKKERNDWTIMESPTSLSA
ncbi:hypothetical protein [Kriegella aquimaris]|uniref:Uncharacterized protein n=1 Tax=Kriegella aquimaris TaxID=192904 RepID=A0A1G9NI24_9FLAO|nr:hypothetical protein [Kriegella aquimaris]SDL85973.1 hypothetical protein SAMN04488514_103183 [Kriegella aquimaris]